MILATIILLIAVLALVVIGFILDRRMAKRMESGMRKMYKRIKQLEKGYMPTLEIDSETMARATEPCIFRRHDDDTQTDSETQTQDGGDIPAQTDDTIQETGD